MAQVGTPVGVRKPVLWEPNSNLGSPLHGEARREDERAVRGGRGERGGAGGRGGGLDCYMRNGSSSPHVLG